jgi:TM2 domain-containing membrane protein YozV
MNPPASSTETGRKKKPWLAALLSLLAPGLGQIYCGQDNKGVFLVGMALLGQWSTGGLSSWILCPAVALDAFMIAGEFNALAKSTGGNFFRVSSPCILCRPASC